MLAGEVCMLERGMDTSKQDCQGWHAADSRSWRGLLLARTGIAQRRQWPSHLATLTVTITDEVAQYSALTTAALQVLGK